MNEFITRPPEAVHAPLFARCFGLSESEAEEIIATLAPDATALFMETGEGISAECFLIPVMLGGNFGLYLYGVCVAPERRGRGYMRRMLRAAEDYAARLGADLLILIPATDALREVYRRAGFTEELPLHADATGEQFYLQGDITEEERNFDGDLASLYLMTDRRLPFSAFCATLKTLPDSAEIRLTADGFFIRDGRMPNCIFLADKKTEKNLARRAGEVACILPLHPLASLPETADPLPR